MKIEDIAKKKDKKKYLRKIDSFVHAVKLLKINNKEGLSLI